MKTDPIIIVRRRKKVSGKGHGSSAWKIAFADFTLSMMAVFLVLWVVGMANPIEKAMIGRYFSDPTSIFETGGQESLIDFGFQHQTDPGSRVARSTAKSALFGVYKKLEEAGLKGALSQFSDNIHVELLPQGVRVSITENRQHQMFERGGDSLSSYFEDLLLNLAPFLSQSQRGLTITGHSDATRFRDNSRMDNWYLSANRANQAREVLIYGGVSPESVIMVSAMADQALLNPDQPYDSVNRRIELMILTVDGERTLRNVLAGKQEQSSTNQALGSAGNKAELNQLGSK